MEVKRKLVLSAGKLYAIGDRWKAEQERACGHVVMTEADSRESAVESMVAILTMLAGTAADNSREQHEAENLAAEWRKRGESASKG
jgi:hypothetical protein